jgi:glutathione synthase
MRALFVMDPLSTIHVDQDSSYVLMLAWQARGGEVWHCLPTDLFVVGDVFFATASRLVVGPKPKVAEIVEQRVVRHAELAAIFKRTDPPFDMSYVFATYMLDVAARDIPVVNAPHALRDANEKMVILRYPDLIVPTLVTRDIPRIRAFVAEHGRAIVKPWDGNGGRGIFVLEESDRNLGVILETSTADGRDAVMVQTFIPEIAQGDKRILLVDGEPRGAFLRIPPKNDHRGNMHVGATVESCEMTERDLHICARLAPYLKENGLVFTGIDVIGNYLTEVNVTSPTGIQECTTLYGGDIAAEIVDVVLARSNQ